MFSEKSGYAKRRLAAQWSGKQSYLNRPFLPDEINDFLQRAPFEKLQNRGEKYARFPIVFFQSNNDTMTCLCILSSWENGIPQPVIHTKTISFPKEDSTCCSVLKSSP